MATLADISKCIAVNGNVSMSIKNSPNFVPKGPIDNKPPLVQLMAWRRKGVKPLYEPMMNHTKQSPWSLHWRHNGCDGVSNHQPHGCLPNRLFRHRSKKTSKLRVTGLCAGNSPGTGEFPAQMASNTENVAIWWRQHVGAFVRSNLTSEISFLACFWHAVF